MAPSKLPLQVKKDIRDHFDSPNCDVQKAFKTLEGIVGLQISCKLEWDLLFNSLEASFPDKTTFVPNIATVITAWCDVLSTRLEDDHAASWTEDVIEKVEATGSIKLQVQVAGDTRPTTKWSTGFSSFIINLPRKGGVSAATASSGFGSDFQNLFSEDDIAASTVTLPVRNNDDGWAEIDEPSEVASISVIKSPIQTRPDRMPVVAALSTPDVLLKTSLPYILHVTQEGIGKTVVRGTHEPSLQFLSQYLQRWIKKDHQDVRKCPLLRITLHESNFGLGLSYDTLTIEPFDTHQQRRDISMNPTILLAIIENVLGYRCLPRFSSGLWEFRREVAFE